MVVPILEAIYFIAFLHHSFVNTYPQLTNDNINAFIILTIQTLYTIEQPHNSECSHNPHQYVCTHSLSEPAFNSASLHNLTFTIIALAKEDPIMLC